MKSRVTAIIVFIALIVLVTGAFQIFGRAAWKFWNIPTLQPPFADARIVTASAESFRLGFDPELENPRDPFGRRFNLPAPWKLLFFTSIGQSQTDLFAGLLISSFFTGLLIFLARVESPYGWLVVLCAFTSPVMLAIERGNVDLFMFFLCSASLLLIEKSAVYASFVLWLASGLKLFPVFAIGALMRYERQTFLRLCTAVVVAVILVIGLDISNLRNAFANTEIGYDMSYGVGVLPLYTYLTSGSETIEQTASFSAIAVALAIMTFCIVRVYRLSYSLTGLSVASLAGFRLSTGIYVGTFLLGSNWDYRLMFLLFALPQLLEWWKDHRTARLTLMAILISLSYFWIATILPFAYFVDEFANWFTFGGLFYLLSASAPEWLRSEIRAVVVRSKKRHIHV